MLKLKPFILAQIAKIIHFDEIMKQKGAFNEKSSPRGHLTRRVGFPHALTQPLLHSFDLRGDAIKQPGNSIVGLLPGSNYEK